MKNILITTIACALLLSCKPQKATDEPSISPTNFNIDTTVVSTKSAVIPRDTTGNGDTLMIITGKRDLQSVDNEIRQHLISVNFWYHRSFPKASEEKRITVAFTINELGVPHNSRLVSTNLDDSSFVNNVMADIEKWRFAKFPHKSDTTTVIYPITLRPSL